MNTIDILTDNIIDAVDDCIHNGYSHLATQKIIEGMKPIITIWNAAADELRIIRDTAEGDGEGGLIVEIRWAQLTRIETALAAMKGETNDAN